MASTIEINAIASDGQPTLDELESAAALIYKSMPPTPQYRWPLLEARAGTTLWVKHENHTPVGGFKIRGGLVYVDELCRAGPKPSGLISATRGNHGQSIGFAARKYGIPAAVVVPVGNSIEKNAAMRSLGVELIEKGRDFQDASETADELAIARGWHRFPNFHPLLVRGVGTYALELFRAVPDLDTVYVPVGLGSGICGVIAARDALGLRTKVVAVVSDAAPSFALSYEQGRISSHEVTTRVADGIACRTPLEPAFTIARNGAERVVLVSDNAVEAAMRALFEDTHNAAEGAGAAALAALLQEKEAMRGLNVAVVVSGGNVDSSQFATILQNTH
ncbi:MAG TPA: threonine dehydratase [Gemmatimonadaceae bacterium]|jgi:threonine dehydratase|nr:threonine dehydratase [Gemmatimonadaceae bacterium]